MKPKFKVGDIVRIKKGSIDSELFKSMQDRPLCIARIDGIRVFPIVCTLLDNDSLGNVFNENELEYDILHIIKEIIEEKD